MPERQDNYQEVDIRGLDLLGHEISERMFLEAHGSGRLHHAWLLTGPRGVGKASLAHKIARFLLHNPPEDNTGPGLFGGALEKSPAESLATDPDSAINKIITAGGHGNLFIVKRQINEKNGRMREEIVIEDVRKMQDFFSLTSLDGGWRVAIIDSADEMTISAANGLLKILEEPPENTLLVLVAHAPGRLLPTIRSRCRKLPLEPLSLATVGEILARKYPDMSDDEISGYGILSGASPGYALRLAEGQGLDLYIQLLEILATLPGLDVPLVHKLADSLARKNAGQKYILFCQLLTSFINRMVRHVAAVECAHDSPVKAVLAGETDLMEQLGNRLPLDQWVILWEKIIDKTGRINLDHKQVILNILTLINQRLN